MPLLFQRAGPEWYAAPDLSAGPDRAAGPERSAGSTNTCHLETPTLETWQDRAEKFVAYAQEQLQHDPRGQAVQSYLLHQRGLNRETWETFQLGFNPHDLRDQAGRWGLGKVNNIYLPRGIVIPRYFHGRLLGVKIRRPLPGDPLSECIPPVGSTKNVAKFASIRGSQHGLFGSDLWLGYPDLLLVEGEWDCMLAWQEAAGLCDVGTLGSATQAAGPEGLQLFAYQRILVVYDRDPAGQSGRKKFLKISRAFTVNPPDHDLTDFWRHGGDLKSWLSGKLPHSPNPGRQR